jgi:hypothetical protein
MLQQKSSLMLIVESFQEIACKLCETLTKSKEVLI